MFTLEIKGVINRVSYLGGFPSHLLDGALSLEEDPSSQQLSEDAPDRPDVDGRAVVPAAHQHLRRSVVLSHHFLGHVTRRVGLLHARQPEITNLRGGGEESYLCAFKELSL